MLRKNLFSKLVQTKDGEAQEIHNEKEADLPWGSSENHGLPATGGVRQLVFKVAMTLLRRRWIGVKIYST